MASLTQAHLARRCGCSSGSHQTSDSRSRCSPSLTRNSMQLRKPKPKISSGLYAPRVRAGIGSAAASPQMPPYLASLGAGLGVVPARGNPRSLVLVFFPPQRKCMPSVSSACQNATYRKCCASSPLSPSVRQRDATRSCSYASGQIVLKLRRNALVPLFTL